MAHNVEEILTPAFGSTLRAAREGKRLSISDIAARLRMNHQYIEAMEAGDLKTLPPEPYRKAFLKEYCKTLGVTLSAPHEAKKPMTFLSTLSAIEEVAADVVKKVSHETSDFTKDVIQTTEIAAKKVGESVKDAVEEITSKDLWEEANTVRNERLGLNKPKQEIPSRISIRKKEEPIAKLTRPIQELLPKPLRPIEEAPPMIRRSYTAPPPPPPPAPVVRREKVEKTYAPIPRVQEDYDDYRAGTSSTTKIIIGLLVVIALIVGYSIFTKKSNKPEPLITEHTERTSKSAPKEQPKKETATPTVQEAKPTDIANGAPIDPAAPLVFVVTAKDSVWVSVTPDIGNGFRGKMKKGETKTFSAKDKYFLFLGNLKALDMTLNGRKISNLPTIENSSMVVRNVILTRDKVFAAKPVPKAEPEPVKNHARHTVVSKPQKKTTPKKAVPPKRKPITRQIPSATPVLPGSD